MVSRARARGVLLVRALVIGVAVTWLARPESGATQAQPGPVVLMDNRDAVKLRLTTSEWQHVPGTRAIQTGPSITVKSPVVTQSDGVSTIETSSPATLSVTFTDDQSPVDMSTLEISVHKGFFSKSLTAMLWPFVHQNALEVNNASIPPGRFLLEVSIADQAGNRTDETYRLEVRQGGEG
jgi:hypothetical protein